VGLPRGARPRRVDAIFREATAVHPTGLLTPHAIAGFRPDVIPAYRWLASALHAHGTRTLGQLFHGGREQIAAAPRAPAVAPSAVRLGGSTWSRLRLARGDRERASGFGAACPRGRARRRGGSSRMRHATLPSIALHPDPKAPKVGCSRSLLCHSTLTAGAP
jgi:hypothetical protein